MLSVIIPTRNRANLVRHALHSLLAQTLSSDRFEVLVIDNGSRDNTRDVVESFRPQLGALRYLFDATPGLHVGRHRGMQEARSELLVYADDDIQATPTWLQAIEECFLDTSVVLVGGNNYPNFETTPPMWLQKLWRKRAPPFDGQALTSLSILDLPAGSRAVSPFTVWGCNFSIRKQVLLDAGGFHPDGMPEERIRFRGDGETHVSAHVLKNGLTCLFDSRASVFHAVPEERMTFDYFRKRAFNQGISDSYTQLRNASAHHDPLADNRGGALRYAKATVRRLRARAKDLMTHDGQLRELNRVMRCGYHEGYAYHQGVYLNDSEVRAWVHKPNYF